MEREKPGVGTNIAVRWISPLHVKTLQEMNPFLICTGSVAMDAVKHLLSQSLNHDLPLAKTYPNLRHLSYRSNTKNLLSLVDVIARVLPYHLDCQHKSASLSFIICIKDLFLLRPIFFFLSGPTIVSLSLYNCCAHYLSVCPFLQFFPCFLHFSFCFVFVSTHLKEEIKCKESRTMSFPFKFGCNAIPSRLALSGPSARLGSNHSPVLATTNAVNACSHRDETSCIENTFKRADK